MSTSARSPVETPPGTLSRQACIKRLAGAAIGRVAWATPSGVVVVLPVNFILDHETIVFGTGPGDKLTAVGEGRPITFQCDGVERALQTGWSVLVAGPADVVEDPHQVRHIEQLQLHTWALIPDRSYVRLSMVEVSGRLLLLHPGEITVEHFIS